MKIHIRMYVNIMFIVLLLYNQLQAALLNKSDVSRYVPAYVWITHAWYKEGWWKAVVANDDDITCSDGEIRPLVERSLAILQIPTSKNFTAKNDVPLVIMYAFVQ